MEYSGRFQRAVAWRTSLVVSVCVMSVIHHLMMVFIVQSRCRFVARAMPGRFLKAQDRQIVSGRR